MTIVVQRQEHLYEQIHEILWDKIITGEIAPSQRLKDLEWAKVLGVSRTPVREAMRKMEQEGILLPLNQGGYEVRPVKLGDYEELYRCRAALEALAAREAAERWTPKAGKSLELLVNQVQSAIESDALDSALSKNTQFHQVVIDLSGNNHLIDLCANLRRLVIYYRATLLNQVKSDTQIKKGYVRRLLADQKHHTAIMKAIANKDGNKAAMLMEKHILETAETKVRWFRESWFRES